MNGVRLLGLVGVISVCVGIYVAYRFRNLKKSLLDAENSFEEKQNGMLKNMALWRDMVTICRPLLRGDSWTDPTGKKEFFEKLYMGTVPSYLWYAMGHDWHLTDEDETEICRIFWGDDCSDPVEFEVSKSAHPEVGVALRVHNAKNFPERINLSGRDYHLYQTGISISGNPALGAVNLLDFYKEKPARTY